MLSVRRLVCVSVICLQIACNGWVRKINMALVILDDVRRNRLMRDINRPQIRFQNPVPFSADVKRMLTVCPAQCWNLEEDGSLTPNPKGRFDCELCRSMWNEGSDEEDIIVIDARASGAI
jgi:ferredoxin-like protein FixX